MKQTIDEQGLRNAMEKFTAEAVLISGFVVNSGKENTAEQVFVEQEVHKQGFAQFRSCAIPKTYIRTITGFIQNIIDIFWLSIGHIQKMAVFIDFFTDFFLTH